MFDPVKKVRDGLCTSCREEEPRPEVVRQEGARLRARQWAEAHPERVKERGRGWRTRLLHGALDKLGGRCTCCGETERSFLQVDHIKGDGGKDVGRKSVQAFYRSIIENESPGVRLRLLCANCHFAHSYRGGCPHELGRVAEAALSA